MPLLRQRVFFATEPPQVHPRRRYSTNKIGIGTPKSQSKIHPTFPSSLLSIAIILIFQTGNFSKLFALLFPVTERFNRKPSEQCRRTR
jgi:hypothetical protein